MSDAKDKSGYLDFDLSIFSEKGEYFAKVLNSPSGASEKVRLRKPYPDQGKRELILRLENAILRARGGSRGPISREERILQDFGHEVFNIVFREPSPIQSCLNKSLGIVERERGSGGGLRIKLRIEPPELAILPWEYVYDGQEYLCLRHRTPLVRFLEIGEPSAELEVQGPLNILGMIANPGGDWELLDTESERRRIDLAIEPLQRAAIVNFQWVPGETYEHLQDMMRGKSWHVFHFIGHGWVEKIESGGAEETEGRGMEEIESDHEATEGFIVLSDGQGGTQNVSSEELSLLLQGDGSLRLVVLNCCEGARGGVSSSFSSVAAGLVRSGVPAVVGMQFPIANDAAVRFATAFYKSIVAGHPIEKAVTEARVAVRLKSKVEWGIPVLLTRSGTGKLFSVSQSQLTTLSSSAPTQLGGNETNLARETAREELRRLFSNQ